MPAMPTVSGREAVHVFEHFDWRITPQSGSPIIPIKPGETAMLSIPDHSEVVKGTLRNLICAANLTEVRSPHQQFTSVDPCTMRHLTRRFRTQRSRFWSWHLYETPLLYGVFSELCIPQGGSRGREYVGAN